MTTKVSSNRNHSMILNFYYFKQMPPRESVELSRCGTLIDLRLLQLPDPGSSSEAVLVSQQVHNGPARKTRNHADGSWHSVTTVMRLPPLRRSQFYFGIFMSPSVGI